MLRQLFVIICTILSCAAVAQEVVDLPRCSHKGHGSTKGINASVDTRTDSIDILHTLVKLDLSDFAAKELDGSSVLTLESKLSNINSVRLDLLELTVDSVTQDGQLCAFTYNDTLLDITFNTAINQSQTTDIEVYYHGPPLQNASDWGGFYWNNTYAFNIGVSFEENPHNYGRVWFPCFDNFIERNTFEFEIKTGSTRKAFCNGLLLSEVANMDGTITWHWEMNQEIPSYLASVAVSDYATVNMEYNGISSSPVPIILAARAADTTALKNSFINLIPALEAYENDFGPYAFDRVGYCVTSFTAGAMEHATNIAYMRAAVTGNTLYETLMAHELSHHWWGDLVTCETAEDMWLNEGWASYAEALFIEHVYGTDAFKEYVRENHDANLRTLHINDGDYYPVSGIGTDLTYSSTVYDKGADMAHSIRGFLGDDVFFDCITQFIEANKFGQINSNDMQEFLSSCSGKDLSSFFDSWIYEPGHHHYALAELQMETSAGLTTVQGSITQKLKVTDVYTTELPINVTFFDAAFNQTTQSVMTYGPCSSFEITLPFEPVYIALDLEEKISDATVDQYISIDTEGNYDFGLGRMDLEVYLMTEPIFARAVQHYIKPDPMENPIEGLHISQERYFSLEGVLPAGTDAHVLFDYNGGTSQVNGFLDNDLITNSEDSLTILYRANAQEDWTIVDTFFVNIAGSINDRIGRIRVFEPKLGDYVLGIYDRTRTADVEPKEACLYTSVTDVNRLDKLVRIYPNPSNSKFTIELADLNENIDKVSVFNILGNEITTLPFGKGLRTIEVSTKEWQKGAYIVSLTRHDKQVISKKIIVE